MTPNLSANDKSRLSNVHNLELGVIKVEASKIISTMPHPSPYNFSRSMNASVDGGNASACAFIEAKKSEDAGAEFYGVGIDANIVTASIKTFISGVNRFDH